MPGSCAPRCCNGPGFRCRSVSRRRKRLAKVANHAAKKDQKHGGVVLLLDEGAQDDALSKIELTDLWGVAGLLAARLRAIGINTPLDLQATAIHG